MSGLRPIVTLPIDLDRVAKLSRAEADGFFVEIDFPMYGTFTVYVVDHDSETVVALHGDTTSHDLAGVKVSAI